MFFTKHTFQIYKKPLLLLKKCVEQHITVDNETDLYFSKY